MKKPSIYPLAIGTILIGTASCATLPKTGTTPSGEPLSVYQGTVTRHHQVKEKVGEVEHKSSDGKVVGTSDVYQEKTVTTEHKIWYPMQGEERVDDKDFFRIGGDADAVREIDSYRDTGIWMNRIGLTVAALGAAAMGAGYYMGTQSTTVAQDGTVDTSKANLSRGLLIGGGLGVTIGGTGAYFGLQRVSPSTHPIDDVGRARAVAKQYNRRAGGSNTARR